MFDSILEFLEEDEPVSPLDSLLLSFALDRVEPEDSTARLQVGKFLAGRNPKTFKDNSAALNVAIDNVMEDYRLEYCS